MSGAGAPEFRVTGTERPFEGSLIQVRVDHIVGPDGREDRREMVEHPGAVAALVVDLEGRVLLVEQWRHATGRRVVEVCAGKYDVAGEAITDALRRELAEELRVEGGRLTWLATFYTTPGWSDEVVDLYLAQDVRPIQGEAPAGDWEEAGMKVVALDYDQAVELATRSSPGDSKTLVALGLYGLMRAGRWKPDPAGAPPPDAPARRAARRAARG